MFVSYDKQVYKNLLFKLKKDPNMKICIYEIDVPCSTKKNSFYSKDKYYECTLEKIDKMLHDSSEPFGHGLCLAYALLEDLNK